VTAPDARALAELEAHARNIRRNVLKMVAQVKGAHLGGGLSVVEIMTALYFGILHVDPRAPEKPDRDRLIFSKGHCATALYATLVERGFAPEAALADYYANDKLLGGHPTRNCLPGVEATTGSLGHGLAMGAGLAWAARSEARPYRVFVVLSDGECDEGSTWEAVLAAGHLELANLVAIVDYNKIQGLGRTEEVLDLEPFRAKWTAFRWAARDADGHDLTDLVRILREVPFRSGLPSVVIAHTVKGKGVVALENTLASHYRAPDAQQLSDALERLGG